MPVEPFALSSACTLGPVHLRVRDAGRTAQLWTEVVGLQRRSGPEGRLDLGTGSDTLLVLHGTAHSPAPARAAGLFHVALELPSRLDLARAAERLMEAGHPCSGQNHLVNESVYFADRDGITIELTISTPERARIMLRDGHPCFVTPDGAPLAGMSALDMRSLRAMVNERGPGTGALPEGTGVGHVHIRSNRPEATIRFYTERLGFAPHIGSASFGMFDCGTASRPHMVAFNDWGGRTLPRPSDGSAGLEFFTVELPAPEFEALAPEFAATDPVAWDGRCLTLMDPDGNQLTVGALSRGDA